MEPKKVEASKAPSAQSVLPFLAPAPAAGFVGLGTTSHGKVVGSTSFSILGQSATSLPAVATPPPVPTTFEPDDLAELTTLPSAGRQYDLDKMSLGDRYLSGGMRMNLRTINDPKYGRGLELNFDVRSPRAVAALQIAVEEAGGIRAPFEVTAATYKDGYYELGGERFAFEAHSEAQTWRLLQDGKFEIHVMDSVDPLGPSHAKYGSSGGDAPTRAVLGKARLRVFGEGAALSQNMRDAIALLHMESLFASADLESRAKHERLALLWQRAPRLADAYLARDLEKVPMAEIDRALAAAGISPDHVAALERVEVFPGYTAVVDPTQGERYAALGVEYLLHGVMQMGHIVSILKSDGLMSTEERFSRGMLIHGASSREDINTGGADSVFLRVVTRAAKGRNFNGWGDYQLIFGPELLDRTDWYAYPGDYYGTTAPDRFLQRTYGKELMDSLGQKGGGFAEGNEIMFRRGIANRMIMGIFARGEPQRQALLEALTAAGISEVNGKPIAQLVQVRRMFLDEDEKPSPAASPKAQPAAESTGEENDPFEVLGPDPISQLPDGSKRDHMIQTLLNCMQLTMPGFNYHEAFTKAQAQSDAELAAAYPKAREELERRQLINQISWKDGDDVEETRKGLAKLTTKALRARYVETMLAPIKQKIAELGLDAQIESATPRETFYFGERVLILQNNGMDPKKYDVRSLTVAQVQDLASRHQLVKQVQQQASYYGITVTVDESMSTQQLQDIVPKMQLLQNIKQQATNLQVEAQVGIELSVAELQAWNAKLYVAQQLKQLGVPFDIAWSSDELTAALKRHQMKEQLASMGLTMDLAGKGLKELEALALELNQLQQLRHQAQSLGIDAKGKSLSELRPLVDEANERRVLEQKINHLGGNAPAGATLPELRKLAGAKVLEYRRAQLKVAFESRAPGDAGTDGRAVGAVTLEVFEADERQRLQGQLNVEKGKSLDELRALAAEQAIAQTATQLRQRLVQEHGPLPDLDGVELEALAAIATLLQEPLLRRTELLSQLAPLSAELRLAVAVGMVRGATGLELTEAEVAVIAQGLDLDAEKLRQALQEAGVSIAKPPPSIPLARLRARALGVAA